MFPLYDENQRHRTPIVTWSLIAINIMFFGFQVLGDLPIETWGLVPARVTANVDDRSVYATVVSSMFLHGSLGHIAGNLWFLHIFGDNLEDRLGHGRYLFFYLLCGIAAAIAQIAYDPQSIIPMIGASGAISGVLAGYALTFPQARVLSVVFISIIPVRAYLYILIWFLFQLISGFATREAGVAWFAHIGGFIAGAILVFALRPSANNSPATQQID